MPDDRFIHPRLGQSEKVGELTDFQYRVWTTYIFAADDRGVMRASATSLQHASNRLERAKIDEVIAALDVIINLGLLRTFIHQKRRYVFQHDWQEWQKVRWPRPSVNPDLPADALEACTEATRELMRVRIGGKPRNTEEKTATEELPQSSEILRINSEALRSTSEALRNPSVSIASCAPAMATAKGLRQEAKGSGQSSPVEFRRLPPSGRSDGVFTGALPRDTLNNVFTSEESSVCVPYAVHGKLITALAPRFSGDRKRTVDALKSWYPEVSASVAADFVMGDAFKFWQVHFDAKWASEARAGPNLLPPDEALAEMHRQDALRVRKPRSADAG